MYGGMSKRCKGVTNHYKRLCIKTNMTWPGYQDDCYTAALTEVEARYGRFKKVKKDDQYKDIPAKYLADAKKKSKRAKEIRRTRRLYKMSKLSPADYDRISRERQRDNGSTRNIKKCLEQREQTKFIRRVGGLLFQGKAQSICSSVGCS